VLKVYVQIEQNGARERERKSESERVDKMKSRGRAQGSDEKRWRMKYEMHDEGRIRIKKLLDPF
jgi:hypothetical protein